MSLMCVRCSQELVIELDDLRVVVGLTYRLPLILGVECLCTFLLIGIDDVIVLVGQEAGPYIGLAAAVDTSARSAHDLDEMIFGLACFDLFQQNLCGFHAGSDGYIHCGTVNVQ